jgi:hypothetical protein
MTMIKDVLSELVGMFVADAWLSAAILGLLAFAAILIEVARLDPLVGGGVLLFGCLALVVESVGRRSRAASSSDPAHRGSQLAQTGEVTE